MILENDFLHIEIAALGAELMHVYDRKRQTELLFNGDPAYWKRRSPILFPNVGKTYKNEMRIGENIYPTSQHGFARDMEFACAHADTQRCCWLLKSNEATIARYPFPFELRIEYTLMDSELKVCWKVKNTGNACMSFTIGGHPAFCFEPGETKQDYMLYFPGKTRLEYLLLDAQSGTALADAPHTIALENGCLPLSDALFAHDALILDDCQVQEVWLCRKNGDRRMGMRSPDFPNFGIWSVQGAPFVCLEPWQGRCDHCGFSGQWQDKPGVTRLEPGAEFEKSYSIVLPE